VATLILMVVAPIGAWIQLRRQGPHRPARTVEVYLLWWLAVAVGVSGVLQTAEHVFNGAATAEDIGFTRGDSGFQFENAMGDFAIGVAGLLCIRFRGLFWLAVLIVTAVQYYGDAIGHVYQWIENDNTNQGNIGPPLWVDLIVPTVGLLLYWLMSRARARESAEQGDRPAASAPAFSP
jgi:hypothetical protein